MRPLVLIALFVLALLAGLLARAPLSAALALSGARAVGLDWRAAEGVIWNGHVRGVMLHDYELGDAYLSLSPVSLLSLSPALDVVLTGPEADARGRVTLGLSGVRVSGGTANVRLAEMTAVDPRLRARDGTLTAQGVDISWRGGVCRAAAGDLASDALAHGFGGEWRGPALAGGVACAQDGALTLRLAGEEDEQHVEATARVAPEAWEIDAAVRSSAPDLARVAPLLGFQEYGEGWRYRWRATP